MTFNFSVRVYIEDTDVGGIVYYVNYLKYMERARTELLRSLGYQQKTLKADGLIFVVSSLSSEYRAPAMLDDELNVVTVIKALSGASIVFGQSVFRASDGQLLSTAEVKVVSVRADNIRPVSVPKALVAALRPFADQRL